MILVADAGKRTIYVTVISHSNNAFNSRFPHARKPICIVNDEKGCFFLALLFFQTVFLKKGTRLSLA